MNWDRIEGAWTEYKGKALQQWGKISNDEMDRARGDRMELVGLIQKHYGKGKDEAEREVEMWQKTVH